MANGRVGGTNTLHKLDRNNCYLGFFINACLFGDVGVSDRPISPCRAYLYPFHRPTLCADNDGLPSQHHQYPHSIRFLCNSPFKYVLSVHFLPLSNHWFSKRGLPRTSLRQALQEITYRFPWSACWAWVDQVSLE